MADTLSEIRSQAQKVQQAQQTATSMASSASSLPDALRQAVSERYADSPLMKERETQMQTAMTAGPTAREYVSGLVQGGNILSPTQQQAITSRRIAADIAPLASLNDLIRMQTGGIENIITSAGTAAANQAQTALAGAKSEQDLLNNLLSIASLEEQQRQFDISTALSRAKASSGSGGLEDFIGLLNAAAQRQAPTATQEANAIDARQALLDLDTIKNQLFSQYGPDNLVTTDRYGKTLRRLDKDSDLQRLFTRKDIQQYQDAAKNIYDILKRARSGAATSNTEDQFYQKYIPMGFDNPETSRAKIERLNNILTETLSQGELPSQIQQGYDYVNQVLEGLIPTVSADGQWEYLE